MRLVNVLGATKNNHETHKFNVKVSKKAIPEVYAEKNVN